MGTVRVGLSGWDYDDWRGTFYPAGMPTNGALRWVGEHFPTVEVNRTFYSLVAASVYRRWYRTVPDDFVFAVKGSRYITHMKRLRDPETPLANFFASGVLALDEKLGPVLWQLPASQRFDAARVDAFLDVLPRDTAAAADLARRHDHRVRHPTYGSGTRRLLHHVLEVRHESFLGEPVVDLADRHDVSVAVSHSSRWPSPGEPVGDVAYVRLHGPAELYSSGYSSRDLRCLADRVRRWRESAAALDGIRARDVFVYFDNDAGGHAPRDAQTLRSLLEAAP